MRVWKAGDDVETSGRVCRRRHRRALRAGRAGRVLPDAEPDRKARAEFEATQARIAEANRTAIKVLCGQGLPVRDVDTILGFSPQRVSALQGTHTPSHA